MAQPIEADNQLKPKDSVIEHHKEQSTSADSKLPDHTIDTVEHYKDWPNTAGFNASEDHKTPFELTVSGNIPSYASGVLYRTGPGGYKVPFNNKNGEIATSHWFDGFTTTHKFEMVPAGDSMKVTYSSYCQVDQLIETIRKTGRRDEPTFGQKRDPCDSLFRKIKTLFHQSSDYNSAHGANIGVAIRDTLPQEHQKDGRNVMTLTTDTAMVKQFDMDTLEPIGVTSQKVLHPSLSGPLSAAHAARDPENGDLFNYNLAFGRYITYRVFRASPSTGEVEILATIGGGSVKGAYLHSMLLTENFVVLCIWPAYYRAGGVSILWTRNLVDAMQPFDNKEETTWIVIDRRHGRGVVKKFTSPALFCFHTVNAWEERAADGSVDLICELIEYPDMAFLHWFYYENLVSTEFLDKIDAQAKRANTRSSITRYKLANVPLTGTSTEKATAQEILRISSAGTGDLPQINPHYALKQHRYVWTVADTNKSSFVDTLSKIDTVTKECTLWHESKQTPGEAIFIPRPGATEEDDGVILTVVLDGVRGTSYLLCLDAHTMKELGRADVAHSVGFGFHGAFVPEMA